MEGEYLGGTASTPAPVGGTGIVEGVSPVLDAHDPGRHELLPHGLGDWLPRVLSSLLT